MLFSLPSQVSVDISSSTIRVAVLEGSSQRVLMEGKLTHKINTESSLWSLEPGKCVLVRAALSLPRLAAPQCLAWKMGAAGGLSQSWLRPTLPFPGCPCRMCSSCVPGKGKPHCLFLCCPGVLTRCWSCWKQSVQLLLFAFCMSSSSRWFGGSSSLLDLLPHGELLLAVGVSGVL